MNFIIYVIPNFKVFMIIFLKKLITERPDIPSPYTRNDSSLSFGIWNILYLNFNVANPTNAKIIAIIQKRITIVDSAQPFFQNDGV